MFLYQNLVNFASFLQETRVNILVPYVGAERKKNLLYESTFQPVLTILKTLYHYLSYNLTSLKLPNLLLNNSYPLHFYLP